jgi:plasmid stabilization system protein ParE
VRLTLSEKALADLDALFHRISADNPAAALTVLRRIRRRLDLLLVPGMARMGRRGPDPGTHEVMVGRYIVAYEVIDEPEEIVVLAVFHGARRR